MSSSIKKRNGTIIGCFKYFIMPNKRRRIKKSLNLKAKASLSRRHNEMKLLGFLIYSFVMFILCLNQVFCIEKESINDNNFQLEGSKTKRSNSEPREWTKIRRLEGDQVQLECGLNPLGGEVGVAARPQPEQGKQDGAVIDETPARAGVSKQDLALPGIKEHSSSQADPLAREEQYEIAANRLADYDLNDSVELILWYHSSESKVRPIYSVDARFLAQTQTSENRKAHQLEQESFVQLTSARSPTMADVGVLNYSLIANVISDKAKHFALVRLSSRIKFRINKLSALLIIDKLEPSDAGQYKCRVDFKFARTKYQLSQVEVITPVSQLDLRLSDQFGANLWPKLDADDDGKSKLFTTANNGSKSAPLNHHQSAHLTLLELNEDEQVQFECRAKDGWPKTKLAWWRIHWPNGQLAKVTQLSNSNESLAKVAYAKPLSRDLVSGTLADLIDANITAFSESTKQTNNNSEHVADTATATVFEQSSSTTDYSNVNSVPTDDDQVWMANKLNKALEMFELQIGNDKHDSNGEQVNERQKFCSSSSTESLVSELKLASVAKNLAIVLANNDSNQIIGHHHHHYRLQSQRAKAMWQFLRQNKLVLYTCGASNTHGNHLVPSTDKEQVDKLAGIRPLFKSILVQANTRPRLIQMSLVSRRREANKEEEEHIELNALEEGQNLHLNLASHNLAAISRSDERQIQLVCQIWGSKPEAKVDWTRQDANLIGGGGLRSLVSDSSEETKSLVCALSERQFNNNNSSTSKQWSSLRLRNISIEDHETVIKCSAFNEKFSTSNYILVDGISRIEGSSSSRSDTSEGGKLSTSIRLNITHVPMIKLELERSYKKFKLVNNEEAIGKNVSHLVDVEEEKFSADSDDLSDSIIGDHHHHDHPDNNIEKIEPVLYGQNVTLVCNVTFANPTIIEPIEWTLNDTQPLDKVNPKLVRVVGKIGASLRYHYVEKLIVQFSERASKSGGGGGGGEFELQLKCKARNSIGESTSNVVRIITGQLPFCSTTTNQTTADLLGDNLNLTDKNPSIECPVISDKASTSSYHWFVESTHETTISKSPVILLSKFNLRAANNDDDNTGYNRISNINDADNDLKITCYAIDKFGSNDKNPCSTRMWLGTRKIIKDDANPQEEERAKHNCAVNIVYSSADQPISTTSIKPKLLLAIDCKDNQSKRADGVGLAISKNELVHFDLYQKRNKQFIKHLTSYQKEGEGVNLSLKLDLGQYLEDLKLEDLLDDYMIIMSVTDTHNQFKQPNVTLFFKTNLLTFKQWTDSKSLVDSRTNDSGHKDRQWVITSVSIVFISSIMLMITGWVCKSSNSETRNNKSQGSRSNCETKPESQQTEMYLVGEAAPRPIVYHNSTAKRPLLKENQCRLDSAQNPYEFLIIDPANDNDDKQQQQQTILLIDPELSTCSSQIGNHEGYTTDPVIHLHPVSSNDDHNAILRALYNNNTNDHDDVTKPCLDLNLLTISNANNSSSPKQITNDLTISTRRLGFIDPNKSSQLIRSSIGSTPIGYNAFELNSQGELTMTDESSSFVHEDTDSTTICTQCRADSRINGQTANCGSITPIDLAQFNLNSSLQSPPSSSQSSTVAQQVTTLKRQGSKKMDRVRFLLDGSQYEFENYN